MAASVAFCPPILAKVLGGGAAFTMYATTTWFRVDVMARDARGRRHAVAPTALARHVVPSALPFLAGSDHFRRTNGLDPLRAQLEAVARVGCVAEPLAQEIELTLVERAGALDGPETKRSARVACSR